MTLGLAWVMLYVLLAGARLVLAHRYAARGGSIAAAAPGSIAIVQPILSGDPALASCLARNLVANPQAHFLWLVDDDDATGCAIATRLAGEHPEAHVTILAGAGPRDGENPKMAKLMRAQPRVTDDVLVVLDDDTVLPAGGAASLAAATRAGGVATGLPIYAAQATLAERLVAGFVNGQAVATYFAMAAVGANHTINGMVYAMRMRDLADAGGFAAAGHELTDDYAVAKLWRGRGRAIVQTAVFCDVVITFATLAAAARVLRRWLIFANRYLRRNLGPATVLLVVLPSLLPLAGLILALAAPWPWAAVVAVTLVAKAAANGLLLRHLARVPATPARVLCEVAADLVLPLLYVASLVRPAQLVWRTRRIEMRGDTIRYR